MEVVIYCVGYLKDNKLSLSCICNRQINILHSPKKLPLCMEQMKKIKGNSLILVYL